MFFSDYKEHKNAVLRKSLLWEYDVSQIDWKAMRTLVVTRVIERGRLEDYYAILNLYGLKGVRDAIRNIAYLNRKDMVFVCTVFNLRQEELKCCLNQSLMEKHWNS